jgi:hypothetical protein
VFEDKARRLGGWFANHVKQLYTTWGGQTKRQRRAADNSNRLLTCTMFGPPRMFSNTRISLCKSAPPSHTQSIIHVMRNRAPSDLRSPHRFEHLDNDILSRLNVDTLEDLAVLSSPHSTNNLVAVGRAAQADITHHQRIVQDSPPLNGQALVVPVLPRALDIDISINARPRHGAAAARCLTGL